MKNCIFCKIIKGEIPSIKVWEDAETYAFMDINPTRPGHMLIIPKKHVDYIFETEEPLFTKLFVNAKKLSKALKSSTGALKIGLAIEGIAVRHVHLHLIPVNNVNDLDPCKSKKGNIEELKQMAEKIRKELKD
ncbi:HIT domain protein [uncultured archaeon]|nr:HIT domain protein [uncultured archaeon]